MEHEIYVPLTTKQKEIMELLSQGFRIKAISEKLMVSESTVKTHLIHIYNNLGISDSPDLNVQILAINLYRNFKNLENFYNCR